MIQTSDHVILPLYEEQVNIGKHTVEQGRVHIHVETQERVEIVNGELASNSVEIERVPIGAFVEASPEIRREGNVIVYPVLEEVFVKRLILREEVRVTQTRHAEPFAETVTLRRQDASAARSSSKEASSTPHPL